MQEAVSMSAVVMSERVSRLGSSIVRDLLATAQNPNVISFAGGLPAPELLPELGELKVPAELGQYGETEGDPLLRGLISQHLRSRGLDCPKERILVLSGSQQGIDLVAKLFLDAGSSVIVERPTYLAALQVFRLLGADVRGLTLLAQGADARELTQLTGSCAARLAYLVPTYQNPTGITYSADVRRVVAQALDASGTPLFEDDPYAELRYSGPATRPIASYLRRAPWIYQSSFSKWFMPGIRLGFLAASEDLFTPLVRLKQASDLHSNRIAQWLAVRELSDPGREQRLERLRAAYRQKRDAFACSLYAARRPILLASAAANPRSDVAVAARYRARRSVRPGRGVFCWARACA
jgi:2-aminoadipate transaminase